MKYIPLSRFAASPFSRSAAHCGKGDGASAAGRPLRGARGHRARRCYPLSALRYTMEN